MLSIKAAPLRWLLRLAGGRRTAPWHRETAPDRGKRHYLAPFARLLLAVAALRDKDIAQARETLAALAKEYPRNPLYREELARMELSPSRSLSQSDLLPRSTDVFVIGGGPAGLAAAIAARHRGFRVSWCGLLRCRPSTRLAAKASCPTASRRPHAGHRPRKCRRPAVSRYPLLPWRRGLAGRSIVSQRPRPRFTTHRPARLMVEHADDAGVDLAWGVRITAFQRRSRWPDGRYAHAGSSEPMAATRRSGAGRVWTQLRARQPPFRISPPLSVAPWSEFMEIHWGDGCQVYITPVSPEEVCVVLISRDPSFAWMMRFAVSPRWHAGSACPVRNAAVSPHHAA